MKLHNALILAAGRGNRISKSAGDIPKPLLPLSGKPGDYTFLDFHLLNLDRQGLDRVVLVGNSVTFKTELKIQSEGRLKNLKVDWVLNPTEDLSTSGSAHSAQYAWKQFPELLNGKCRTLLMDADIVYDPAILKLLENTDSSGPSKNLICTRFRDSQEEVVVYGHGKKANLLGKAMVGTKQTKHLEVLGEATGIVCFEPTDHELVQEITDWCIHTSSSKARSEHEDISARLMLLDRMESVPFDQEAFMECDTPEEYQVLQTEMYPKIKNFL